MPFYGDCFWESEAVARMDDSAAALYLWLLWREWRDGPLPDPSVLRRLPHRWQTNWDTTWPQVAECFRVVGDRLVNDKVEELRADRDVRSEISRRNGSKGGRPKRNPELTQRVSKLKATPSSSSSGSPSPSASGRKGERGKGRSWAAALDKHLGGLEDRAGWEEACEEWASVRRGAGHKPWRPSTWAACIKDFAPLGLAAFREAVERSASKGWQGLFLPREGGRPAPTPETSERARMEREGLGLFAKGNGRVIDVQPS